MVATPGDPDHGIASDPKNGALDSARSASVKIDIAYGGSCTAGKRDDVDMYARVMADAEARRQEGRRRRASSSSSSARSEVEDYAKERGYIDLFQRTGVRGDQAGLRRVHRLWPRRLRSGRPGHGLGDQSQLQGPLGPGQAVSWRRRSPSPRRRSTARSSSTTPVCSRSRWRAGEEADGDEEAARAREAARRKPRAEDRDEREGEPTPKKPAANEGEGESRKAEARRPRRRRSRRPRRSEAVGAEGRRPPIAGAELDAVPRIIDDDELFSNSGRAQDRARLVDAQLAGRRDPRRSASDRCAAPVPRLRSRAPATEQQAQIALGAAQLLLLPIARESPRRWRGQRARRSGARALGRFRRSPVRLPRAGVPAQRVRGGRRRSRSDRASSRAAVPADATAELLFEIACAHAVARDKVAMLRAVEDALAAGADARRSSAASPTSRRTSPIPIARRDPRARRHPGDSRRRRSVSRARARRARLARRRAQGARRPGRAPPARAARHDPRRRARREALAAERLPRVPLDHERHAAARSRVPRDRATIAIRRRSRSARTTSSTPSTRRTGSPTASRSRAGAQPTIGCSTIRAAASAAAQPGYIATLGKDEIIARRSGRRADVARRAHARHPRHELAAELRFGRQLAHVLLVGHAGSRS